MYPERGCKISWLGAGLVVAGLEVAVFGQPAAQHINGAPPEAEGAVDQLWWERERITGDWWGLRSGLGDVGLSLGGEYIAEFSSVLQGGVNERGSFRNLLMLEATLDLGVAFGWEGGTVYAQYVSVNPETGGSRDAGDIQAYSNIENDYHMDVIYEMWFEQVLFDERLRLKVGKVDANSEFDLVAIAGDFSNSSAGFSPTIITFPSYPDSAMSVNIFGKLLETEQVGLTLGYGFYDGAAAADGVRTGTRGPGTFFDDDKSDDYFHIAQMELVWGSILEEGSWLRDGRLSLGGWLHTGEFDRFDGGMKDDPVGLFATLEQLLLATGTDGGEGGLYVFGQYGWADDEVSEFGQRIAGGVVLVGTFPGRENDRAGVYFSYADLSDKADAGFEENEFVVDVYYRLQMTPSVFVQPEVQYIVHPSGDPDIDNALVVGLRVGVVF